MESLRAGGGDGDWCMQISLSQVTHRHIEQLTQQLQFFEVERLCEIY